MIADHTAEAFEASMEHPGQVTRSSPVPLYEQLKTRMREYVVRQGISVGAALPSTRELCAIFSVSHQSVNRALDDLKREGILYRVQGKGTFVRAVPRIEAPFSEVRAFTETLRSMGLETHAKILDVRTIPATPGLHAFFQESPDSLQTYCEITRLRYAADIPVVLNTSTLQKDLGNWMMTKQLETASYYQLFSMYTGTPVTVEDHTITICKVSRSEAAALQVRVGSDHFLVEGKCYVGHGQPIETSRSIFHRQHFQFHVRAFSFRAGGIAVSTDTVGLSGRKNSL